ncbi:MAG TPA: hypothetical protein VER11_09270 [Polyangiaceae bacterium]|nr:hypothetical protein [Polyangiaceae bacterium]
MRIRTQRTSPFARVALLVFAAQSLTLFACGGDQPPAQLPSTSARDRMATRVELVDLVISDPARAAKVRSLYMAMDELLLDTKRAQARQLALVGTDQMSSDDKTRAALASVSKAEKSGLERYMELQLQLRRFVTADEFARLDAIR